MNAKTAGWKRVADIVLEEFPALEQSSARHLKRCVFFAVQLLLTAIVFCPLGARGDDGETGVDAKFNSSANLWVNAIAVQHDGKLVIGGAFSQINGVAQSRIARLNPNGSLDTDFTASASNQVFRILVQNDGKLIICGYFDKINGVARHRVARLNADGTLDTSFVPAVGDTVDRVYTIALQSDGKLLIGGNFSRIGGVTRFHIARLNLDGSLDTSFNAVPMERTAGADSGIYCIVVQPDGRILIGGQFRIPQPDPRDFMARLNVDGSLDTSFNAFDIQAYQFAYVFAIAVQPDGKIVIGGRELPPIHGVSRPYFARLTANGSLDAGFDTFVDREVRSIKLQGDGKILLGGEFLQVDSEPRGRIARLDPDGNLEPGFNSGSGADGGTSPNGVLGIAVQEYDDRVVMGGYFTSVDGKPHLRIARFNAPRKPTGDLLMKEGDETFAGNDVYQTVPGGSQLRSDELAAGVPRKYTIKVQNDRTSGPAVAFRFRTEAAAENLGWDFRLMSGQIDISAAASSADGWTTPEIVPLEEIILTLEAKPKTAVADEAAQFRVSISMDEEPERVVDALGINIERSDVIIVNQTGDADDPTPEDGSPDVDASAEGPQITLRSAINFSNRKPTRDTIEFNVEGSDIPVIKPAAALPAVTAPTVLAGDSSAGGKVELDGSSAGEVDGLTIQSEDCVVRGFVINSFFKNGIEIGGAGMNRVEGCRIGTDVAGSTQRTNRMSGIHITSAKNTIGGSSAKLGAAPGNVISGNGFGDFNGINAGIFIEGAQANENIIIGNLIGTDASGANALGNEEIGVFVVNGSANRIGGTSREERNVVSGNSQAGIVINGGGAKGNRVLGNFLGTEISGSSSLANAGPAVQIEANALENIVGGTATGSRNVIVGPIASAAGRSEAGVSILNFAKGNFIQGNYIGTDATGERSLGARIGVGIGNGIENVIGGYSPGARNIISGNSVAGVLLIGEAGIFPGENNVIAGNFIGTNKTGALALPNGTSTEGPRAGVLVEKGSSSCVIGGPNETGRNVISGNQGAGVLFNGSTSRQITVFANYIGTRPDGQSALPNDGPGVWVRGGNSNVAIGAIQNGFPNRIAFNQGPGVFIENGTKILIFGNEIFRNLGLGIDLGPQGPTLNDRADADNGPNQLQNFPILETVARLGDGSSRISGRLDSRGGAGDFFGIAFYTSASAHASGAGEGETFLGYAIVPANPFGVITFDVTIPKVITPGLLLTATATDMNSNTSEFSAAGLVEGKVDTDADGVTDDVEDQVPSRAPKQARSGSRALSAAAATGFGDGNGDGIADSKQNNVTSFPGRSGQWQTLISPDGTRLANIRLGVPSDFDNLPEGYTFPVGFLSFTVDDVTPGNSVAVTNIFHGDSHYTTLFAFGPTPDDPQPHWYEFLFDGSVGAQIKNDEVLLTFVDGGRGDHDLQANGRITTLLAPAITTTPPGQLLNIATRLRVQTGENVLIGGLIVTGTEPKKVIIRGIGPSLSGLFAGALADPMIKLYQGDTLLASNDNWKEQQAEIEATTIPPVHDLESAIVQTLAPGSYTAVMSGQNGGTGIGVIEAYDLDQAANSKLANIATRGFVDSGDNVMIGGVITGGIGGGNTRVLIRAIGPSLTTVGIKGALQDPTLELRDTNGGLLRENDNWQSDQLGEIEATTIPPTNAAESAIISILTPGNYTAIVRGKDNTTGVGLVEVYNLH
jgi:uncharacterized delta-60 repeat protein